MTVEFLEDGRGFPDKHAAIPIVIPTPQILCGLRGIRFLNKPCHRMTCQFPLRHQANPPVRLDIAVAGFRSRRRDTERHQIFFHRQLCTQRHCRSKSFLSCHHMISREDDHDRLRVLRIRSSATSAIAGAVLRPTGSTTKFSRNASFQSLNCTRIESTWPGVVEINTRLASAQPSTRRIVCWINV